MEKHDEGICKMSEILGDTGKRVSGGRALLLCICHECGSNFEIQRRRFSQLKPCLRCLRKKQNAYKPFYAKIEELEHEIERLNKFCKEFIYGEDNPKYYKTMDEKIAEKEARILELKETRDERNIERAFLIENNCLEERYSEASHYNWLDDKNEELEHKLELAKKALEEIERFQVLTSQDIALPMEIARETLGQLK